MDLEDHIKKGLPPWDIQESISAANPLCNHDLFKIEKRCFLRIYGQQANTADTELLDRRLTEVK